MISFIFSKKAKKQLKRLSCNNSERIIKKLKIFKKFCNLNSFLKIVYNLDPATHRMRIWNFRLLVRVEWNDVIILKLWHRRDIYK